MKEESASRGGIARPPESPFFNAIDSLYEYWKRLLAEREPPPSVFERFAGAIPLVCYLSFLLPLTAIIAARFEKIFIDMDLGELPILTALGMSLKDFILEWTIQYMAVSICVILAYSKWISRHRLRIRIFNILLIVFMAFGFLVFIAGLFMPFLAIERPCLLSGTPIETPGGPRTIESIHVGDRVWMRGNNGSNSVGTVTARYEHPARRWLLLEFEDGRYIRATPEHPFGVPKGWTTAGALRPGDEVCTLSGTLKLISITPCHTQVLVYDLTVESEHTYFANDVLVHNKIGK